MFRSMTAYVYKTFATSFGQLTIEIQSLNRKHLDIHTTLQSELARYENDVRKEIGSKVHRGKVAVKIYLKSGGRSILNVTPNLQLAKLLKQSWQQIADEFQVALNPETLMTLVSSQAGILKCEDVLGDDEGFHAELLDSLRSAIDEFLEMKTVEGCHLYEDVNGRIDELEKIIQLISTKSEGTTSKFREKLISRIAEVVPGAADNDDRVLREVCLFAERIDTTEEVTRFQSHISQFRKFIAPKVISIGKKLEFLLQEMLREVNTIGSKTSELEVSHLVVEMKSELEKIREQLQNVE